MARSNLRSDAIPRNELDHRARDTRIRLVRLEQLVVNCDAVPVFWRKRLIRLLGFRIDGLSGAAIEAEDH
jgi:hypothetical protein